MADYIDRDRLIKKFCNHCYFDVGEKNCAEDCFDVKIIKSLPTEDVAPVVHGKWEEVQEWMGDVEYSCSVCGCYAPWKELTTDQVCTEYCPNCGAKMDGEA